VAIGVRSDMSVVSQLREATCCGDETCDQDNSVAIDSRFGLSENTTTHASQAFKMAACRLFGEVS
jgi:hypothetical protein